MTSIFTILFVGLTTFAVCASIADIYENTPELKYFSVTMLLGSLNVVPVIVAVIAVIRFALRLNKSDSLIKDVMKLFLLLKKVFVIQAGYTLLSVGIVGFMENVGPPFYLIITMAIVFTSLTLALLFDILREGLKGYDSTN